jgi:broad specificity phosphatase PhoE
MKTTIYLIRHGESQGNAVRAFLGHTNLDLTQKGHDQAECTARYLKNIHADVIYSSDLLRAYNTAKHTADLKGIDIIKNENLREIFAGDWETKKFDDLMVKYPHTYAELWKNDIGNSRPDNGESVAELKKRISVEITKIVKENTGKTIFIFTHATPIRTFKAFCENKSLDEMNDIPWASNASVSIAEYEDGSFTMINYSIDDFIDDELITKFPKSV